MKKKIKQNHAAIFPKPAESGKEFSGNTEKCKSHLIIIYLSFSLQQSRGQNPSNFFRGIQLLEKTLTMLIEEAEATEEHNVNVPKPSSSSTNKDASDGFETASDGELGPNESDDETQHHLQVQEEQQNLSQSDDLAFKQVFANCIWSGRCCS